MTWIIFFKTKLVVRGAKRVAELHQLAGAKPAPVETSAPSRQHPTAPPRISTERMRQLIDIGQGLAEKHALAVVTAKAQNVSGNLP